MSDPKRLLDLFCGAGGAAMGYHQAGFTDIVGVDIEPQPNYPFEFIQDDALTFLRGHPNYWDFIHASPPCQSYSKAMKHLAAPAPELIDPVRALLKNTGTSWVIENVVGAPLNTSDSLFGEFGAVICGTGLGLRVWRHRLFESSFPIVSTQCNHAKPAMNPHNGRGRQRIYEEFGRQDPELPWRKEMGVAWMSRYEAREAIPPAYTRYIGEQFLGGDRR